MDGHIWNLRSRNGEQRGDLGARAMAHRTADCVVDRELPLLVNDPSSLGIGGNQSLKRRHGRLRGERRGCQADSMRRNAKLRRDCSQIPLARADRETCRSESHDGTSWNTRSSAPKHAARYMGRLGCP